MGIGSLIVEAFRKSPERRCLRLYDKFDVRTTKTFSREKVDFDENALAFLSKDGCGLFGKIRPTSVAFAPIFREQILHCNLNF